MRKYIVLALLFGAASIAGADKSFSGKTGASWDCKTDPVVVITGSAAHYTFKGECKSINVTGGHNALTIESVGELDIIGSSNTVSVDALDALNINGAGNKVAWKKGKSGDKPTISQLGQNNAISQK